MPDKIARASPGILPSGSEWNFENIAAYDAAIGAIAAEYGLDTYPNQIEVISSEQMMDAYSSVGMPIGYHHWSFGKQFIHTSQNYQRGRMGLAYEIVINSNPCIAYLMEENTLTMQALVIAHACYGHNSFFKGNYLFRTWTDADSIIDYLVFARQYITKCEERYGTEEVEKLLDSCHALMNHGVDRYQRPYPISAADERLRQKEREEYLQKQVNDLWRTIPLTEKDKQNLPPKFPAEPQENILYFLEKNAPLLEPWQREIVRIVRKLSQYFYPQRQTQVMNEGWATFWHYTLLQTLYERQQVSDGFMLEFLQYHTSVLQQPDFDSPYYSGINPYTLGFHMMSDIRRICENPTEEDRSWFPDIAGSPWVATLQSVMKNYKDESFIQQFLSPKVIRDLKLFAILDDEQHDTMLVAAIHDDSGYKSIRAALSAQYNLGNREPNIEVDNVDIRGDRSLTLTHHQHNGIPLAAESTQAVLKHLQQLWGFDIHLHSMADNSVTSRYSYPALG